ncbi:RNA polymerase III-inhibiting protein maf1 [Entophlyctis luteolus]|nr:RNA polymerase III-inhibiting protein maf1 [Entophlyctis luteolus]
MKFLEYSSLEEVNTAISCVASLDTRRKLCPLPQQPSAAHRSNHPAVFARIDAYSCKNTTEDKKLKHHIDEKYSSTNAGASNNTQIEDLLLTPATSGFVAPPSPVFSPSAVSQAWAFGGANAGAGNGSVSGSYGAVAIPPGMPSGVGSYGSYGGFGGAVGGSFGGRAGSAGGVVGEFASGSYAGGPGSFGAHGQVPVSPYGQFTQEFMKNNTSDVKPELFFKIPSLSMVQSHVNSTLFGLGYEGLRSQGISDRLWEAVDEVIELIDADIYSFNPNPEVEPDSEEGNLWSFYYFFFNRKLKRIVFFTARAVSYMAPVQPEELANDIYGDNMGDEPMFDSEM